MLWLLLRNASVSTHDIIMFFVDKLIKKIKEEMRNKQTLTKKAAYKGPAKSFVTGFGLLQCYVLSDIFLLQTFKVFPLY